MLRSQLLTLALTVAALPAIAQVHYRHTGQKLINATENVVVADFNRDGLPDIAFEDNEQIHVILNAGGGAFGAERITSIHVGGTMLAVDLNGDQWPDLMIGTNVFINKHDGTFTAGMRLVTTPPFPDAVAAGDLNGDGKVDLVVGEDVGVGQVQVFIGDGTGSFVAGQRLALSQRNAPPVDLVDVNGDGKLDLVVTEDAKVVLWPGTGRGTFGSPSFIRNPMQPEQNPIVETVAADFNNDGIPDLALVLTDVTVPTNTPATNHVFIYRNDGRGHFTRVNSLNSGAAPSIVTAGDLNGDGNTDLLFADGASEPASVYRLGNGNGTFGVEHPFLSVNQAVIRDLSLDGRNDVATVKTFVPTSPNLPESIDSFVATNGSVNCAPPSSAHLAANICMPSTASAASPLLIRGSGNSPIGVKRVEIWIDGRKAAQKLQDQIGKKFTLAPGTHRIVVVAVDKYLGTATTVKNVTVQ